MYVYKTPKTSVSFNAKSKSLQSAVTKKTSGKIKSVLVAMLFILGAFSCKKTDRESQICDYDGVTVEFQDVKNTTKDSLMTSFQNLKSQLNSKNDFLKNLKIDVARSFSSINDNDSFKNHLRENARGSYIKGLSFYSDSKLTKRIAIQERAHNKPKEGVTEVQTLRQTLMHEVGHQFDNYFGHDHQADYAIKWDSLQASKQNELNESPYSFASKSEAEMKIDKEYALNNGLSDKKAFKDAFLKDIMLVRDISLNNPEMLPRNINYYIKNFDLTQEINAEQVEESDVQRAEVYANLFSYIVGEDEGNREDFLKTFPNCYEIVKKDIATYLKIQK